LPHHYDVAAERGDHDDRAARGRHDDNGRAHNFDLGFTDVDNAAAHDTAHCAAFDADHADDTLNAVRAHDADVDSPAGRPRQLDHDHDDCSRREEPVASVHR
jgi:hypothetical protein